MNNKITLAVIIILLLLGGGYMLSQQMKKTQPVKNAMMQKQTNDGSMMTSIKDLLGSGKNQVCTFEDSNETVGTSKGTTYIANGKMRTDFSGTDAKGKPYDGSMINDGMYMYTWTSTPPQGMKIKITAEMEKQIQESEQTQNVAVDPNRNMKYSCDTWNGDAAKFTPPANVQFTDFSAQLEEMKKLQPSGAMRGPGTENTDMKAAQCAACDSLEGDQKTSCQTALQCP